MLNLRLMLLMCIIILSTNVLGSIRKDSQKNEIKCLSDMIYHEARGESEKGQLAVAIVTINRAKHKNYPSNICDIVYQPGQYSWTRRGVAIKELTVYNDITKLGKEIFTDYHINNKIPKQLEHLESALFFSSNRFNNRDFKFIVNIGKHKFYSQR